MGSFRHAGSKQVKINPSEIIRSKLLDNGGYAVIKQARGGVCQVKDCGYGYMELTPDYLVKLAENSNQ